MTPRHSWVKLKEHAYMCVRCGTGKRNAQDANGGWFATFHQTDGQANTARHVPKCEPGLLTIQRLMWLDEWRATGSRPPMDLNGGTDVCAIKSNSAS